MSSLNPEYEQFAKDIEALIASINEKLRKLTLTDVELSQLAAEMDFFEQLKSEGFENVVNKYFNNYDEVLLNIATQAQARGVDFASVNIDALVQIKDLDKEYLIKKCLRLVQSL